MSYNHDILNNIIPFSQDSDFDLDFINNHINNNNEKKDNNINNEYDEIINEVYDHIVNLSFGQNIVSNHVFLQNLRESMYKFVKIISYHSTTNIGIIDSRNICDSILGKKEKMTKKRKLEMTLAEKLSEEKDNEKRLCFDTAFVLLFYKLRPELSTLLWDVNTFKANYFSLCNNLTDNEIDTLLKFRNMIKVAIQVIPASGNKGYLLDMVTRIVEGHRKKYITGSGATSDTLRRVKIYETEGNVHVAERPERKKSRKSDNNSDKVNNDQEDIQAAQTIALLLNSVGDSQEWNETIGKLKDETVVFRNHSLL